MDQREQPNCSAAADKLTPCERTYENDSGWLSEEVGTITRYLNASFNNKILVWFWRM